MPQSKIVEGKLMSIRCAHGVSLSRGVHGGGGNSYFQSKLFYVLVSVKINPS